MDNLTPGRKLILDLLAKSVAKIQATEAKNEVKVEDVKSDGRKGGIKRESMEVLEKSRKKMKAGKKPEELDETKEQLNLILKPGDIKAENVEYKENKVENSEEVKLGSSGKLLKNEEVKIKSKKWKMGGKEKENVETPRTPFKIKTEYTEMKTEEIDLGSYVKTESKANVVKNESKINIIKVDDESKIKSDTCVIKKEPAMIKSEYSEIKIEKRDFYKSYANHEIKVNELPYCSILNIVKNENNKDSIKEDDNLHVESKNKSNTFEQTKIAKNVKQKDLVLQNSKRKYEKRIGFKCKRFSSEEDKIILEAIEKFGDKIDIAQIAEDLQRTVQSIRQEVLKLKAGKEKKKIRKYTLAEDLVILDAVLENLGEDSLKVVNLTNSGWRKIGAQIGKLGTSLRTRWDVKIRPWILQHFAGTRNLDLKRPLANYLAQNFLDVNSIDWSSVVSNPEFAGHTQISLRKYFSSYLFRTELHKDAADISLKMIAEFANTKYAEGGRKVLDKDLKRQQEIIDYFEGYVKTKGIENFL